MRTRRGARSSRRVLGVVEVITRWRSPARVRRFDVASRHELDALARAEIPGLRLSPPRRALHRDLYLDTPDDILRKRGLECRLRIRDDDTRELSLHIRRAGTDGERESVAAPVRSDTPAQALAEAPSIARRLRALLEAEQLGVRLDIAVERLTRTATPDWLGRPRVEVHYDCATVRGHGSSRSFHSLCLHARPGAEPLLQRAMAHLVEGSSLRPGQLEPRERAELLLKWMSPEDPRDRVMGSDHMHRVPDAGEHAAEFLDPELSLLAFQLRVLALAENPATPLRERLRFLAIVSANVDEFYMVRMAGLRLAAREQFEEQVDSGFTRGEQVERILTMARDIVDRQSRCWRACERELAARGVRIVSWASLNAEQKAELRERCAVEIQPALTPLAMTLSPGHPLPRLPHLSLSLAVVVRERQGGGRPHLAELELPPGTTRFFAVPGRAADVVTMEDIVRGNLDLVYPGRGAESAYLFRVTRGGDLDLDEEHADSLLDAVAAATEKRPTNPAVRVEVERRMPGFVRDLVLESLRRERVTAGNATESMITSDDVHEVDALLDLRCLFELPVPESAAVEYPRFVANEPFANTDAIFAAVGAGDVLVHHPFDSFAGTVVRFLQEAAADPDVTTIKITLYRVGAQSPVVEALLDAARAGKRVVAFMELKARFDEDHNVSWARALEQAGGNVVYGLVGLKNHAKTALVVRRENGRLRRYAHVSTGNYNARSGLQYTDLSLFSARDDLTSDVADLFNALTGSSRAPDGLSRGALVSPHQLLPTMLEHIEREAANARAGRPARITAKFNGLSDPEVVRALYRASGDGVQVDLVVRGICTLRPRVPGRSERIRVVSVVGRFLEHSRIYRFENAGDPVYFIGSSDLRPRNLRRRVELLVPIYEAAERALLDLVLSRYLSDDTGWELRADGGYDARGGSSGAQDAFMRDVMVSVRAPAAGIRRA